MSRSEIEDGMGFAGLVGDSPEEREIERLEKQVRRLQTRVSSLVQVLDRYMAAYPAFRIKPEGAPGSQARLEQERLMALEDAAVAAIGATRVKIL